jgi:hypothetical protein
MTRRSSTNVNAWGYVMIRPNSATTFLSALIVVAAGCVTGTSAALVQRTGADAAAPGAAKTTSSAWTVYVWDRFLGVLHANAPTTPAGAVAGFPLQSNMTGLLTTTSAPGLVGNLTGKSLSATVSLAVSGSVVYGLEGSNGCSGPATMRLFISTDRNTYSPTRAGRNETGYWWSNPFSVSLDGPVSGASISVPLIPSDWSDANGHFGSDAGYTAGFTAAVSNLQQVGVSFGGGCFFDTGIGVSGGSGSFTLNSIAAQ